MKFAESTKKLMSKYPFLNYAVQSWFIHVQQSEAGGIPAEETLELFTGTFPGLLERWHTGTTSSDVLTV